MRSSREIPQSPLSLPQLHSTRTSSSISTAPPCCNAALPQSLRRHSGALRFSADACMFKHVRRALPSLSRAQRVWKRARRQAHTVRHLRAVFSLRSCLGVLIQQTLTGASFPLQVPFGARLPILQPNSPPMLSPMDNGISSDGTGAHTHFALDGLRPISPARRLHSPGFTGVTVRCIGTLSVYMSMHMYVSVHMSVQYLFTCMYACQHTCLYRHACTFVSNIGGVKSDAHAYAHARACMTACLCTCLYAYLCAHLCTYPFTCLSTRLHTCLYTGRPAISSPLPSFVVDDVSMLDSTNVSDGGVHSHAHALACAAHLVMRTLALAACLRHAFACTIVH